MVFSVVHVRPAALLCKSSRMAAVLSSRRKATARLVSEPRISEIMTVLLPIAWTCPADERTKIVMTVQSRCSVSAGPGCIGRQGKTEIGLSQRRIAKDRHQSPSHGQAAHTRGHGPRDPRPLATGLSGRVADRDSCLFMGRDSCPTTEPFVGSDASGSRIERHESPVAAEREQLALKR